MSSTTNNQFAVAAFYLNGFIREMIPIYPLYAVMFGEHGVSPLELSLLFSIWAAVGILTEVPSGALADSFSRKWLIVASGFLKSSAFICWYFFQDFYGFALGFILWGLASSIRSGAWEALLHDILKHAGETSLFTRHYGRIRALGTSGVLVGELTGGILIMHGYDFVLLISAIIPVVASIVFLLLVTDPPIDESVYQPGYMQNLKAGIDEAFTSLPIRYILLTFTFLIMASGILDEYVNPILFEQGFSLSTIAYLSAGIALFEALGNGLADRFSHLSLNQLLGLMAGATCLLFLVLPAGGYAVPLLLGAFFAIFGLASTLFSAQLQDQIEGSARATVTSVVSLGDGIGAIIWFMVFGSMAEASSMTMATSGFAVITLIACGVFFLLGRRWQITHEKHH